MSKSIDIMNFNAAFNPIGYDAKYHHCDRCGRFDRCDILEFFDRNTGEKINAHFVVSENIFKWINSAYRIKSSWEARDIVIKQIKQK